MSLLRRASAAPLVMLILGACAGHTALAPVAPARAAAELNEAQTAFASEPTAARRLELGQAQYRAGHDSAARATLAPLLNQSGTVGAEATLFDAAAADRLGDYAAARRGYLRYLSVRDDAAVRGRLAAVARKEADAAAKAAIASERSLDAGRFPPKSVGVAPLYVASGDTMLAPLGYGLADLLITDLSRSAQLQVVDRVRVDALLKELHLASNGRVDSASAPRVGKLVGARRLVNGALGTAPNGGIVVNTRIADAAEGKLVGAPITEQTSLNDILDAEKTLALRLFEALGVTLTPAERAAVEQRPTRYLSAFLAYSKGVRAEALGNLPDASAYYESALLIDPGFRLASTRLSGVQAAGSTASPSRVRVSALNGIVDALNPSPAASLGTLRDRGDTNERSAFDASAIGTLIINITTPTPVP
jgi:TolB-like protein